MPSDAPTPPVRRVRRGGTVLLALACLLAGVLAEPGGDAAAAPRTAFGWRTAA